MTSIVSDSRPRLARGVRLRFDRISGKTLLLRPEQGFELQGSALEIVQLLDGERTVATIATTLAGRHPDVPPQEIAGDIQRLLGDLNHRGVVVFDGDGDGDGDGDARSVTTGDTDGDRGPP